MYLTYYGIDICREWKRRGFQDSCEQQIREIECKGLDKKPWWLGDPRLHLSHQSNLIRKAPWAYAHLWPTVDRGLDYWWPTQEGK